MGMLRLVGATWIALGLSGLAASRGVAETLRVITPHPEEVRREFEEAFIHWHQRVYGTQVDIDWRDPGGSGEAQRYVENEFKAHPDGIGMDVFFGGGPEPFLAFASRHWLDGGGVPPEATDGIPPRLGGAELYDPERAWFGACLASFGILQNLKVQGMAQLPRLARWEDLARPELRGWVAAGDPRNSGTMNNMYEAILQAYGWERGWRMLTAMSGNVRRFDRFSSQSAKECTLGQVAYAFCIDYYGFIQREAAGADGLEFVLPEDFTSISPDGIAMLRGAPHAREAARFVTFVLSEEGQTLWYLPMGTPGGPTHHSIERLPVRPELYKRLGSQSRITANPFTRKTEFHYDARLARNRRDAVRTLFGCVLVDLHPELLAAWEAVVRRGHRPEEVAALGTVPISESQALEFGKSALTDARLRQRMKLDWQEWARAKYRRLAATPSP